MKYGRTVRGLRRSGLRVVLCVGLAYPLLHSREAAAAPTARAASAPVAVTPFSGLHADEAQAVVLKVLGDRGAVVRPNDVAKVAPYVVVAGQVVKRDTGLVVEVTVTSVEKNTRIGQVAMPVPPSRHLAPEQLAELGRQVDELVTTALAPPVEKPAEPQAPPVEAPAKQAQDVEKAPLSTEPPPVIPPPQVIQLQPPPPKHHLIPDVPRPPYYPWIEAHLGAITSTRSFTFNPVVHPIFKGGTAGGIVADVTAYPLAFLHAVDRGAFAGLGAGITVELPFWPTTNVDGAPGSYATFEKRIEGGARWKFLVNKHRGPRLEVTVLAGAGLHTFTIAKKKDPKTMKLVDAGPPDMSYVYGAFGGKLALHIKHRIIPWVSMVYEYFPDAGSIENLDEYGLGNVNGFNLRGGVEVRVWRQLTVGAGAFWERIFGKFSNNVVTQKHASSFTDMYYGGVFTAGYSY
jgi:hypothetical protein